MSTLFRTHRGTLEASVEVYSREELIKYIWREMSLFIEEDQLVIQPYGFNNRMGWETYIIILKEPIEVIIGFLDGPLDRGVPGTPIAENWLDETL